MGWDEVGYATKIDRRMDGELYMAILEDELQQTLINQWMTLFSNRTMTPSTPARPKNGLKTMTLQSSSGLHNLQTLVPLNTFGIISREAGGV